MASPRSLSPCLDCNNSAFTFGPSLFAPFRPPTPLGLAGLSMTEYCECYVDVLQVRTRLTCGSAQRQPSRGPIRDRPFGASNSRPKTWARTRNITLRPLPSHPLTLPACVPQLWSSLPPSPSSPADLVSFFLFASHIHLDHSSTSSSYLPSSLYPSIVNLPGQLSPPDTLSFFTSFAVPSSFHQFALACASHSFEPPPQYYHPTHLHFAVAITSITPPLSYATPNPFLA